jgi:hypothetical protein
LTPSKSDSIDEEFLQEVLETPKSIKPFVAPVAARPEPEQSQLSQSSDEETNHFMKIYMQNDNNCELLGPKDQQLIYGNVGLTGADRESPSKDAGQTTKRQKL